LVADLVEGKPAHPLLRLDRPSLKHRMASASEAISR
jgi:hypothetical protein